MAVLHADKPEKETLFVPDAAVLHLADEEDDVTGLSEEQLAMRNILSMARLPEKAPRDLEERVEAEA
jgi:hypothetical protein